MVFLVERYNGHFFSKAVTKEEWAKSAIDLSVLYIPVHKKIPKFPLNNE
jgi:hypothetical protein